MSTMGFLNYHSVVGFLYVLAFLLTFPSIVAQQIFVQQQQQDVDNNIQKPGVNDGCAKYCDEHFESKGNSSEACKQGCRLFSIIRFTNGKPFGCDEDPFDEVKIDKIRDECVSSCGEGYPKDKTSQVACSYGCRNQTVETGSVQIELDSSSPFINKLPDVFNRFFGPTAGVFKDLKDGLNDMMQSARNGMFSTSMFGGDNGNIGNNNNNNKDPFWSTMMQQMKSMMDLDKFLSRDNKPVAKDDSDESKESAEVKSKTLDLDQMPSATHPTVGNEDEFGEPVVVVHMVPLKSISSSSDDNDDESSPLLLTNLRPFVVDNNNKDENLSNGFSRPNFMMKEPKDEFGQQQFQNGEDSWPTVIEISQDDWLACMGRRIRHLSMITRWTLCLAMILSLIGMMWICMAVLRTSPKRRSLNYLAPSMKGGVDNVYYTTPPYSASDKSPMIITTTSTSDYLGQKHQEQQQQQQPNNIPPPPTYEAVKARDDDDKKENNQA